MNQRNEFEQKGKEKGKGRKGKERSTRYQVQVMGQIGPSCTILMQSMQTQTKSAGKKHSTTGGRCLDLILAGRSTSAVHTSAIESVKDSNPRLTKVP